MASLVKEIDSVVAANKGSRMAAVVNFTGEPTDDYSASIKAFGEKHGIKNVALTTTSDGDRFRINDRAEVTVMHYKGKRVAYNYATAKGELDKDAVKAIVEGTKTILN